LCQIFFVINYFIKIYFIFFNKLNRRRLMKKIIIAILAMVLVPTLSYAGSKAEVLHWWTSGGEAKALQVLKDDFASQGGEWKDMPVAGGGGDAAMQTLKARIVANDAPAAAQIKGPTIQAYDREGVVAPYNIDAVAKAEGWDKLLSKQVADHMKCDGW
jgi:glucose/mannose transport system substrate-binding protein